MPEYDQATPRPAIPRDVFEALALLTRLPLPDRAFRGASRGAAAVWAYPLAGVIVGAIGGSTGALALAVGLPTGISAGLMLGAMILVTGALHEDGLADCADGIWGGQDPARRLEIMKDSRIGSYGVIALILSLGLRWAAVAAILPLSGPFAVAIGAAALSRAIMVVPMWALPNARSFGLSHRVGRPAGASVALALVLGLAAGGFCFGLGATVRLVPMLAGTALVCILLARARLGGQTGDVLGATQQVSEIAALLGLAAMFF